MGGLVAGNDLKLLACVDCEHVGDVHTTLLIELRFVGGDGTRLGSLQSVGDVEDDVLQTSIRSNDHVLHFGRFTGVLLGAVRVFRHVNALHVRGRTSQFDGASDGARTGGGNLLVQKQASGANQRECCESCCKLSCVNSLHGLFLQGLEFSLFVNPTELCR